VNWTAEKECFESISREIGLFYSTTPPIDFNEEDEEVDETEKSSNSSNQEPKKKNEEYFQFRWSVEHILFPAFRYYFTPPKRFAASGDILQIADLPDLYKIFERC